MTAKFQPTPPLSVQECAAVMRVSKMTVYRLIHTGELPALRLGRSIRVPVNELERYMRGARIVPDGAAS